MPKLTLPCKTLFERITGRGTELPNQSFDLVPFTELDALEKQSSSLIEAARQQQLHDNCYHPSLQRSVVLQRSPSFSPWIDGDFFLCVSVKEGIDLSPAVPMPSATCDSFVRVTLQRSVQGGLPLEEAETRVIYRNCYPMWEECLPFPLDNVTEDTCLSLRVMDKDIGHFNSFVGTVSLPIKEALEQVRRLEVEKLYKLPLLDRQNHIRKRGELVFGVAVVAKQEYKEMRGFISSLQDPDTVHDSLRDYCLHLKLHALKELSGISPTMTASLVMEVTVCSFVARKTLDGKLVGGELDPEGAEVVIPLGPAFKDGDILKGKNRAQFGEIKVELWSAKTRLAKTQVPIWDVPVQREAGAPSSPPESDSESELERDSSEIRHQTRNSIPGASPQDSGPAYGGSSPGTSTPTCSGRLKDKSSLPSASAAAAYPRSGNQSPDVSRSGNAAGAVAGPSLSQVSEATMAAAASRHNWDGKRYNRRMERVDRSLTKAPLAVLSMQLVKAEPGESDEGCARANSSDSSLASGGNGGDVFDGADTESPSEPLAVPPLDGVPVADFMVGLGPSALLKAIYAEGAELTQRVFSLEKVTELKVAPWGPDPESKALCVRSLTYMKPSPVGPVAVQSQQKVMLKQDGGFVLHQYVTPNVPPVGLCVRVFAQIVGQHVGPNKTRFTAAVKLEWLKSGMMVNMIKGKIEDATPKDTRKFFETLKGELATKYATADSAAGVSGGGEAAAPVSALAPLAATTAAFGGGSGGGGSAAAIGGGGGWLSSLSDTSFAIMVGVVVGGLFLVLLLLVGAMRQVRGELARSQRALEGLSQALEVLTEQLAALAAAAASDGVQLPGRGATPL